LATAEQVLKLTSLSSCAGCASKLSRQSLTEVLRQVPVLRDRNVLVGAATGDDAGVYKLDAKRALVQTTDFFTPIVDDPYWYGQISATNALSDVYAMGGRPLTALNLVGIPADVVPLGTVNEIVRGGAEKIREAKCVLIGGHTIKIPEPVFGYAVTGMVSPRKLITNSNARPGDLLVLTKPLGTGIITTGIKRGLTTPETEKKAIESMTHLNTAGADIAERGWVRAGVDVTGFGLISHLSAICASSKVGAEISAGSVPALSGEVFDLIAKGCIPGGSRDNRAYANGFTDWDGASDAQRTLLTDAQTSGGLLLCVPPKNQKAVMKQLEKSRTLCAAVIGKIVRSGAPRIRVTA